MSLNATLDTSNTTSKENMRRKIRHALTQKSASKFPQIDAHIEPFEKPENIAIEFCANFRSAGGKLITCARSNIINKLNKLVVEQNYTTVFNASHFLAPLLKKSNINYITCMDIHRQVDVTIVYADILIARTGSMMFTQNFSLYPSVRNITKDIIVVSFVNNLALDFKDAFAMLQEKNQGNMYEFAEIITPTKPENDDYSPLEPRFILLLNQDQ